ncbi:mucin-13b [Scomber scombrus]|uniref:Mucin-13b n=1 Tax=Scomber scombrus TaxID=13677 RepID=A0AAV1PJB0_SCOSC
MADKTSLKFQNTSKEISDALNEIFHTEGGIPTVVKLWPILGKVRSRSISFVGATVEIFFKTDSAIDTSRVDTLMGEAIECDKPCILAGAGYTASDLCAQHPDPCDKETANCTAEDGTFYCTCLDGYIHSNFSDRMCQACLSGQQANGNDSCIDCSYGYSGFNCNESWQLVLVIVGSVLGGLLLITIILLPIIATKGSKKISKKKKNKDTGNDYVNTSPAKAPLVNSLAISHAPSVNGGSGNGLTNFANAGVPRIPRATSNNSWDNRTNLEMTPSNSRQNLVPVGRNQHLYENRDDTNSSPYAQRRPQDNPYAQSRTQDSPYAQSRPQSNLYAQNRPQNNPYAPNRPQSNPYAQNRPQSNPYASSQGMTNSYYVHDDGKRFN